MGQKNASINVSVILDASSLPLGYQINQPSTLLSFPVSNHDASTMPAITWPSDIPVDILAAPPTWKGAISIDAQSWISAAPPNDTFVGNTVIRLSTFHTL
jgi:hypothetical protein